MGLRRCLVCIAVGLIFGTVCEAQVFYVCAPSTFRVDSNETIALALEGGASSLVHVLVQDHPGRIRNISEVEFNITPGTPEVVTLRLDSSNFPTNFLKGQGSRFVRLTVRALNFNKELIIPLSIQSGYVFIQTDKPIYTPKQIAHIRIIPLREDGLPSNDVFQLQIQNPQGLIVEQTEIKRKTRPFETHIYRFPNYPVLGEWSATVRYGHLLQQNASVRFELKEYVLPTFTVELKTQEVILPSHNVIEASVTAKYVYGKIVEGLVTFKIGVKGEAPEAIFFAVVGPKKLEKGSYKLRLSTDDLKHHKDVGWFPEIEGSRLVLEASVVDDASGTREAATDAKGIFSRSAFLVTFDRSLRDFKPGVKTVFEADIRYIDGRPAPAVPVNIRAEADGQPMLAQESAVSDKDGKVVVQIQPEMRHTEVTVTMETNDARYRGSQAVGSHTQRKFVSPKDDAYIALERSGGGVYKPGDLFSKIVHLEPAGIQDIYYLVKSRNSILQAGKLRAGKYKVQHLDFHVTHDMVPSFRVLIFAHYQGDLLADSLKIDVEKSCHPDTEISLETEFGMKEPGNPGKIKIKGSKSTLVGLLGVDEAVYALSKKDLLTKDKMFETFSSHDFGCGPGGGLNTHLVLGNAGVVMTTSSYSPPTESESSCSEIKRKKREIAAEKLNTYTGLEKECCALGMSHDNLGRSCEARTEVVHRHLRGTHEECSRAFLHCCKHANETGFEGMKLARLGSPQGRMGGAEEDNFDFIPVEEDSFFENEAIVRKDFKETWLFHDITIGPDQREVLDLSLPHSITTWVLWAVSVHPRYGMCVLEPPVKVLSFKKIFLQLQLPYSVVRNEQVEVRATLFNYGDTRIRAVVYMYGVKNLCTGTEEGEKSVRKRLIVEPHGAASVAFPVVPLEEGIFPLKVVALSPVGSDIIQKDLYVVPEGVTKEVDISVRLDPTNQQKRKERHINTEHVSDFIDPTQNLQVIAVELKVPEGFVPGTESCTITALGDQLGPTVQTALTAPESLIEKPRGCGEQNMMFLAPTLYTMRYLKVTGKMTPENEEKGYGFIRHGYGNQLSFRKEDGSFAAYQSKPTSTWLTAFVMKVFCQASELIHIDEHVLCGGVRWLVENQQPDGSYLESHPMYHVDMMGGVQGKVPMTAFTLIALEECSCEQEKLHMAKARALSFLEEHLGEVVEPLPVAIVAYALSLGGSELKEAANDKLLSLAHSDVGQNQLSWQTSDSARDVETAGYALLNQLHGGDLERASRIVNWLNTKRLQAGSFKSTQDTVVALQALSEYAIRAQAPSLNLVANLSSSNDRLFQKTLSFHDENAILLQDVKIDKVGGTLFVKTAGQGIGSMSVKLRYNLLQSPEMTCKFDVKVNVTEPSKEGIIESGLPKLDPRNNNDFFDIFPEDLIRGVKQALIPEGGDPDAPVMDGDPRNRGQQRASLVAQPGQANKRVRREDRKENSQVRLLISICSRYLGNLEAGMSIVDVGLFSGFEPEEDDLKNLEDDPAHLIQRYEKSKRGIVFYLQKVPNQETYCFDFHVNREFLVGTKQSSVIKIYDYYNPDESCTVFYSPSSNSPILHKLCDGGVCQCAEGGCPPRKPFSQLSHLKGGELRKELKNIACEKYDFVWLGEMEDDHTDGGFRNITFRVDEVFKEGIEKRSMTQGAIRNLLARDNCETAVLHKDVKYLIMSKDGQKYMNERGDIWHRYLLGNSTAIHLWVPIKKASDAELQKALNHVTKNLKTKGCDM